VAAYIELNAVRAGLCADPKDYRYCGYAEALAKGCSLARQGISILDVITRPSLSVAIHAGSRGFTCTFVDTRRTKERGKRVKSP
jgi:hypothetical protein